MILEQLKNKIEEAKVNSFKIPSEIARQWAERVKKSIEFPLSTGFKLFDDDLDYVLRGELCAAIGYGGTKKSLWSLNCSNVNSAKYKARAVYSTMEMSPVRLLDRVIDFAFGDVYDAKYNASKEYRRQIKDGNFESVITDLENLLKHYYNDRLIIDSQPSMNYEKYKLLLDGVIDKHGGVDVLVVDGLSMMQSLGTENDSYSQHTKDLKRLAIEYDVFVIIICHVSKGASKTERDVSRLVRGSEKILDNCDFYLMFSLIENSFGEVDKTKGWIRLNNKRGSGSVIDQIYTFDNNRLMLCDSSLNPNDYEIVSKQFEKSKAPF